MMKARSAMLLTGALLWLAPGAARAAPRDPAAAEALFAEGRRALESGDTELACEKFRESQRLDPATGTLLNLATCEEKRGKTATAWQLFQEALDALPPGDDRVAFARERVEALSQQLPKLLLRVDPPPPSGTVVLRDGVPLEAASLGSALPLDPGEHSVVVQAPGHEDQGYTLTIEPGEEKELVVAAGPERHGKTPAAAPETPVLGWALVGAGGVSLGIGVTTAFMLKSEKAVVDEHCTGKTCDEIGLEAAERGDRLVWVNAVAFGAGAAALGTGLYFVLTADEEESAPARKVSAKVVRGGAVIRYGGVF